MRRKSRIRASLSVLLVLALLMTGCGSNTQADDWAKKAQSAKEAGIDYVYGQLDLTAYANDNDDLIFLLERAGRLTDDDKESYVKALSETVQANRDWERMTQWQRIAFAVASCGADPKDIAGMDFLTMALSYDIADENNAVDLYILNSKLLTIGAFGDLYGDRALLVERLLGLQNEAGAFVDEWGTTLDSTSLTLQALAASGLAEDETVRTAIDEAVAYLSAQQSDDGSFLYNETPSLSSTGQACLALATLGIDPATDERFIKGDGSLWQALIKMYEEELQAPEQDADFYGRVQGLMGLVAIERLHNGETPYYSAGLFAPKTVAVAIEGDDGVILPETAITWQEGDTAYSVLRRAAEKASISVVTSGSGNRVYVKAIGGLHEFDKGSASGWIYAVNGDFPGESSAGHAVAAGDTVKWIYTLDQGQDAKAEQ